MKKLLLLITLLILFSPLWGHDVYIVNSNDETLSHYDTDTQILENHILQLGQYANQIVIQNSIAYVVNSGVHNIQIIDLETETTLEHIQCPNGSNPYWMALHPDWDKAYVSGLFTNTVYVIDLIENSVVNSISVGSVPEGMFVYDDKLFVMNSSYGSPTGSVTVIDVNNDSVIDQIPVGNNPQFGAVDAMGRLHVVCTGNYGYGSPAVWGEIYIINTTTHEVITTLEIGGSPTKIAIHQNGTAYLCDGFGLGFMAYNSIDLSIIHSSADLWASGGSFIHFDENGILYLGDSVDWINNGKLYIYSENEELLHTLTVGVNPQDAGFYYPGVGVDILHSDEIVVCNYPNPFSNSTTIYFNLIIESTSLRFTTPWQAESTEINIFNIKGQLTKTISSFPNPSLGMHEVRWDGTDNNCKKVPGGVYLYKITSEDVETSFHKMIYLR